MMSAALHSTMDITIGGQIILSISYGKDSVGLSGSASVSGVTISAPAQFEAGIEEGKICLNQVQIDNVTLNYSNVAIQLNDLGHELNELKAPIRSVIEDAVKDLISMSFLLSGVVTPAINSGINDVLPKCSSS